MSNVKCGMCGEKFQKESCRITENNFCCREHYWQSMVGKMPTNIEQLRLMGGKKGWKQIEKAKKLISMNRKGKGTGESSGKWRGDDVGYRSLHTWVERNLGKPHLCENCNNNQLNHRQYHWANKSGLYQRIIKDWIRLCVKCHKQYDKNKLLVNN